MAITRVVMPKLSEAMETAKVIKWLRQEGDRVQSGDIIAEIETDKADVEMEAFGGGVLRKVLVGAGERAPVGSLIGVIAEPGEDIAAVLAEAAGPSPAGQARPAPAAPSSRPGPAPAPAQGPVAPAPAAAAPAPAAAAPAERLRVSPLARKIAAQAGVDLRLVQGTGPGGRIIRRDVEAAAVGGAALGAAPALRPVPPAVEGAESEVVPLSPMRAAIARQMPLAKAPVPHFYVTSEVAMDRAWELRQELNALEGQPKISVNDLVLRAAALALLEHPHVNASFQGDAVRLFRQVHLGLAVALDEGLITPVLRHAEAKSLVQLAVESRDLVERARARKLKAHELSGATFSISNLGMYDVTEFSAIINPPEAAILAVGAVRQVPVVAGPGLGVGRRMNVTLSCDHRAMDGAIGARFLQTLKRLLEEPLRLLV